uniref:Uncharacterized protein n=1 Tax=Setaria viridis TaxID=4556 RepID=A0A4U6UKY0_SETVI|nr:hypothetical protein SEVIR_5G338950v2 [Setaria viridis]
MRPGSAPDGELELSSVAVPRSRMRAPAAHRGPTRKVGGARWGERAAALAHWSSAAPRFVGEVAASCRQWATPYRRQEGSQTQTSTEG